MPRVARFWDALSRFGQSPLCKQPGICSENSGLRWAISELARCGEAPECKLIEQGVWVEDSQSVY
jgi:hypothetical protein